MRLLLLLLFVQLQFSTIGQPLLVGDQGKHAVNLAYDAEYVEDAKGQLLVTDVIKGDGSIEFRKVNNNIVGFGLTTSFFWLKTEIRNNTDEKLYLKISSNPLTDIDVYETSKGRMVLCYHTGNWQAFKKRVVPCIDYLFPLHVRKDSAATIFIRVRHFRGTVVPLHAGLLREFYVADLTRNFIDGIYYGLMLLIVLYNLFIYLTLRDVSYLYYVMYVFLIALFNASMDGYAFRYLWPSFPAINQYEDIIGALVGMAAVLFASSFLNTKNNAPVFHKIFIAFLLAYVVIIAIIASKNFIVGTLLVEMVSLLLILCIFVATLIVIRKGYKPAKFFFIGWSLLLFSATVFIMKDFGILPYNDITTNALQIGSAVEALLLSIALADRINLYRKERARAQKELIKSLQEKSVMQTEMLELEALALRSQMNPHFIFNCMNSIKALIQQKDEDKAVRYLTTFSKLLRTILQNSDKREVSLFDEIETCRLYAQLESLRFTNKFIYSFSIDESLDLKSIKVPALIIQPFIENAIWHGLMPKEEPGYIEVSVKGREDIIYCTIDDNGIGREASLTYKYEHQEATHVSKGVKLTQSRLDLDNALNKRNASVGIVDKKNDKGAPSGTTVILTFKQY